MKILIWEKLSHISYDNIPFLHVRYFSLNIDDWHLSSWSKYESLPKYKSRFTLNLHIYKREAIKIKRQKLFYFSFWHGKGEKAVMKVSTTICSRKSIKNEKYEKNFKNGWKRLKWGEKERLNVTCDFQTISRVQG